MSTPCYILTVSSMTPQNVAVTPRVAVQVNAEPAMVAVSRAQTLAPTPFNCAVSIQNGIILTEDRYRSLLGYVSHTKEAVRNARAQQQDVIVKMERELIQLREQLKAQPRQQPSSPVEPWGAAGWRDKLLNMTVVDNDTS